MIVLLNDRWSYFGAVAQIAPDGPKCPMIGHPVFQCRFCRVLQKSVRIAVIEPAIQHISVFCVRNFTGGIDHIAPPVLRRSGQRKCPENVPLSIDALISVGGGILLQRMVGRPEGLPAPIVQNPAGDLSGGAPQLIRLVYRPELYGGCPMEGRGRVPEKVVEDHPAGRLSRQLQPYPGYAQRCFGRSLPPGRTPER